MSLPEGLYLRIDRIVENVKCKVCHGTGLIPHDNLYGQNHGAKEKHNPCRGTGILSVQIQGWVEVKVSYERDERRKYFYFPDWPAVAPMYLNAIPEAILAAWRDGTLPKLIAKNIEEVNT